MNYEIVPPSPESLIESLRSVGYTLPTAVADIADNSIAAGAKNIWIDFHWAGRDSHVAVVDDGNGMAPDELTTAMRHGSRNPLEKRSPHDLGRFGLGLKTASLSQCRNLSVLSKKSGNAIHARTWDLKQLADGEWRLLLDASRAAKRCESRLGDLRSGTAVVWSDMDRLVESADRGEAVAHAQFNDSVDHVRSHLALIYHRFLEDKDLRIYVNGSEVAPWDPFMRSSRVQSTVVGDEPIQFGRSAVVFKGFVLPHKDRLTEEEFEQNKGPRGWAGQQGFYVYRNRRLLVYGDWLRLGRPSPWTKEEHYRLARIQLDIPNDSDIEWQLDVKKSTARPPALLRERLTDLADNVRSRARSVFAHRGKYGTRVAPVEQAERPWVSKVRENRKVYGINRKHPAVQAVLSMFPEKESALNSLLRLLEETVPVQQIWLDAAEQRMDHAAPYSGVDFAEIKSDMRKVLEFLKKAGINHETALQQLRGMDPFDRYPALINEL